MVGGPTPRFVTNPVPTSIGALPMSIGIGTPIGFHASRHPAATMAADIFPMAVRTERLIKVALVTDDHLDGCGLDINRRWRCRLNWRWRRVVHMRPPINEGGASG